MNNRKRLLKNSTTDNDLKIYDLYQKRIHKEYDLIWSRFKLYFGFISGTMAILLTVIGTYIYRDTLYVPDHILVIIILLSLIGLVLSILWLLININGRQWMFMMNKLLAKIENKIFYDIKCAMYSNIMGSDTKEIRLIDVTSINIVLSSVFIFLFLFILILTATIFISLF